MKIKSIERIVKSVPYKSVWTTSLHTIKSRDHLIVRVRTDNDLIGLGEASPMQTYMGESAATMTNVIDNYLAGVLVGEDPFQIERIHKRMDSAIEDSNSAKAAIDLALYDLMGRFLGMPTYNILCGRFHQRIDLTWDIGIKSLEETVKEAVQACKEGYRTMKIKIGLDPETDLERVEAVRSAVQSSIRIRVDANQGYRVDQAIVVLRKMEKNDLEMIEQPVHRSNIAGMARIARALDTPVLADESCVYLSDAYKVISAEAADILNIKVGKVGGLLPSKKIAAVAESAGMQCVIGSNLELGIGASASAHFAISIPNAKYASDLLTGVQLHEYDIVSKPLVPDHGSISPAAEPGLGVELNFAS